MCVFYVSQLAAEAFEANPFDALQDEKQKPT